MGGRGISCITVDKRVFEQFLLFRKSVKLQRMVRNILQKASHCSETPQDASPSNKEQRCSHDPVVYVFSFLSRAPFASAFCERERTRLTSPQS